MKVGLVVQAQLGYDDNIRDNDIFAIVNGNTVVETVVEKALSCNVHKVIVLTSEGNKECVDLDIIKKNNIRIYKKDDTSFIKSYRKIFLNEGLDIIIRVIGNNILLIPNLVMDGLKQHLEKKMDYTYNTGYPRGIMFSEIISKKVLFNEEILQKENVKSVNIMQSLRNSSCEKFEMKADREYYDHSFINLSFHKFNIDKFSKCVISNNWQDIIDEFKEDSIPNLNFIINNICNISCIMCGMCGELSKYSKVKDKKGNMNFENFKNIIDKFPKTKSILIQGGEILLNKDILSIIGYAKEKNIKINTITNGLLLNEKISRFLIETLESITFSIDASEAETYEAIRLNGKFNVLIKNISEFMEIYYRNSNVSLKSIKINYVCMEQNYRQMPKFVKLMKKLGIKDIVFSLYAQYKYVENKELVERYIIKDRNDFNNIWMEAKKIANENDMKVSMMKHDNIFQKHNIYNECNGIKESFWINWDGYVLPCCSYISPELYNLGNVTYEDNMDVIINNWKQFRWNVFNSKIPKVCYDYCIY
ncbi:hypothetical protein HBE96_01945 [Clostridium sp. P21]|uniref:Radical SAM core domain-containing protein n=1 Tax=Clostridium muellerianum TaxID=2716538 RepID=A0A7Y0EDL0_9CLOT|nr:radical SAM protein [Clostridium muellerianum]NMM61483.1 hypothetical protein [Clostridium muellerianum]